LSEVKSSIGRYATHSDRIDSTFSSFLWVSMYLAIAGANF